MLTFGFSNQNRIHNRKTFIDPKDILVDNLLIV